MVINDNHERWKTMLSVIKGAISIYNRNSLTPLRLSSIYVTSGPNPVFYLPRSHEDASVYFHEIRLGMGKFSIQLTIPAPTSRHIHTSVLLGGKDIASRKCRSLGKCIDDVLSMIYFLKIGKLCHEYKGNDWNFFDYGEATNLFDWVDASALIEITRISTDISFKIFSASTTEFEKVLLSSEGTPHVLSHLVIAYGAHSYRDATTWSFQASVIYWWPISPDAVTYGLAVSGIGSNISNIDFWIGRELDDSYETLRRTTLRSRANLRPTPKIVTASANIGRNIAHDVRKFDLFRVT